jgi:prepilin-type N-terminal cleavage/methylation domain-containing protein
LKIDDRGFTLLELVIVALIISIIVAIVLPNFIRLQARAKEASVKANMHTLQMAFEDFAVQTGGWYPDDGTSATPSGDTVADLCPLGTYPINPFTHAVTNVLWDADPVNPGEIGANPAITTGYTIKGHGNQILLLLQLTPGM